MLEIDYGLVDQSIPPFVGVKDSGLYAELLVTHHAEGLRVQTYIEAPGRGNEILELIGETLGSVATERGRRVIHVATPENDRARKLFARTDGYTKTGGYDRHRNPIYEKVFYPGTRR